MVRQALPYLFCRGLNYLQHVIPLARHYRYTDANLSGLIIVLVIPRTITASVNPIYAGYHKDTVHKWTKLTRN